ncbi:hypothetical protein IW261DRAFT_1564988 [Armillaria novae-zelandiae]|uniref:Uncharacterized protein n=1 Tax=Armillaria novae-zelandiae TaxID=153914 RepID=A0AA39P887_9AGAR|nr:hypothetical protein IW261DRAFT_1564988 [Armillaria novae-zelandiae]
MDSMVCIPFTSFYWHNPNSCSPSITYTNGSLLACTEMQAGYVVACLSKLQKQDLKTMEIDLNVQDEYNIQQESLMKDLIWVHIFFTMSLCFHDKFSQSNPALPDVLYAGSTLQFLGTLASPQWEDWISVLLYQNCFFFLGYRESLIKAAGGDRAYYITIEDVKNVLKASNYEANQMDWRCQ